MDRLRDETGIPAGRLVQIGNAEGCEIGRAERLEPDQCIGLQEAKRLVGEGRTSPNCAEHHRRHIRAAPLQVSEGCECAGVG